ncbi:Isochorismatase domain-containing protein 2, mitochondrial [Chlamydiales bacterium STE3]|nr:Isochorismatase domain-containing protein 2, mitochondrial [Chlamydiales bacterium STE3]
MANTTLSRKKAGLFVVDVQEKLFPYVDHPCDILDKVLMVIEGCQILELPILVSEQNPQGLGSTLKPIREVLSEKQMYHSKTTFSCWKDTDIRQQLKKLHVNQWILVGLEAHVCVLQTAKDLIQKGYEVTVLNDAISSRSIYDFSTAVAEFRDIGARVTSTETVLFELLEDAKNLKFKEISNLIKKQTCQS